MLTMAVYYRSPDDPETFEKRYLAEHLPLVDRYEHMKSRSFGKVSRVLQGEVAFSHLFVGHWDDKEGWKADLGSEAAKEATENARSLGVPFDVAVIEWIA